MIVEILLMAGLQGQAAPDPVTVVPEVVTAITVSQHMQQNDNLVIDVGSLVAAANKASSKGIDKARAAGAIGRPHQDATELVICPEDRSDPHWTKQCRVVGGGVAVRFDKIEKTDDGYSVFVMAIRDAPDGEGTGGQLTRYDYAWQQGRWVLKEEQVLMYGH